MDCRDSAALNAAASWGLPPSPPPSPDGGAGSSSNRNLGPPGEGSCCCSPCCGSCCSARQMNAERRRRSDRAGARCGRLLGCTAAHLQRPPYGSLRVGRACGGLCAVQLCMAAKHALRNSPAACCCAVQRLHCALVECWCTLTSDLCRSFYSTRRQLVCWCFDQRFRPSGIYQC